MRRMTVVGALGAAVLSCTSIVAADAAARTGDDAAPPPLSRAGAVFDALQDNVWYLPTADGKARLYVTFLGRGSDVVVLHGGPGNDFNYLVDAVAGESGSHRFVLYDQRGSLLSPVPERDVAGLTAATMVEDLETLRVALGKDRLVLLGHSWGTLLAMLYFQAHPDHVAALVLAGSIPPRTPEGGSFGDLLGGVRARQRALRERPEVVAALAAEGLAGGRAGKLTAQQKSWKARIEGLAAVNLVHVERWRALQGGGVYYTGAADDAIGGSLPGQWDLTATLKAHPVPVTVIQGDSDYLDPSAKAWLPLAEAFPGITVEVVPGAGHYSWIDNPAVFHRALAEALERSHTAAPPATIPLRR